MLLLIVTLLSMLNLPIAGFALLQALALFTSLGLTIYLSFVQPQRVWYGARALAESVKTVTWRYVMRAEPYEGSIKQSTKHFLVNLRKILNDNTVLNKIVAVNDGKEITAWMIRIRKQPIAERRRVYEKFRVNDQFDWYRLKAKTNDTNSRRWYWFLVVLHVLAIIFALLRIVYPSASVWPTDFVVTATSGVMAWLQAKRFQELATSYSLTAHDIGLLREKLVEATTELKFSAFVGDAENAFSREHTQWRARRDVE
jgi:hypothetical protein